MGPPKEDETRNQIELVQNFVISNVDGIVLAPLSDQALKAPVRTARKAGIPVVIMDSPLQGEVGKDFVSYVGTDNYDAGALAGERMAEITGGKGRVLLLRYAESSASTQQREQGFLDALKKHAPEVEVVDPPQYAGADANTAKRAAQNMITAAIGNLGGFDAAFCPNESSSKGMLLALNDRKLTSEVRFIGFDACPPLIQAVKQGEMDSFVAQNPRRMGYLAVKSMIDHIQGKQVEESIDTGAILVTAENIDDPEVQKLITPPDQK
jgi:ribose transport system substrate-binding protein